MTRSFHRLVVAPSLLVLAVVAVVGSRWARPAAGPFYVAAVADTAMRQAPVLLRHHRALDRGTGERPSDFLFGCPPRAATKGNTCSRNRLAGELEAASASGGTASSARRSATTLRLSLLFHVNDNGKQGSFQPFSVASASPGGKRSTVSAGRPPRPRNAAQRLRTSDPERRSHPRPGLNPITT